jgi:DNA repair protein RadC
MLNLRDDQGFYEAAMIPKDIKGLLKILMSRLSKDKINQIATIINGKVNNDVRPQVFSLTRDELEFLTDEQATRVLAIIQMAKILGKPKEMRRSSVVDSPEKSYSVFAEMLSGMYQEAFAVIYLNIKNEIIDREIISIGGWQETLVPIQEILRRCLLKGAMRLIVAHNHPSQCLEPSVEDVAITFQLAQAARLINIQLLDHLICSDHGYLSLRQQKAIDPWPSNDQE